MGRIFKVSAAGLAFLLYIWVAAVRRAPVVRARKAARRAASRSGST